MEQGKLKQSLSLYQVIMFGLAYMAPMIVFIALIYLVPLISHSPLA